ncbi:MAG: CoA transferase [Lachnospiraceae bacterium]|nr:CoA transferase [Lachnospiraceae bacterium]
MNGPLEGLKVVELGTHVVVPTAGRFMADLGAEVIKVENNRGEEWRKIGPSYKTPSTTEENPIFQQQNVNKKLIAINLKSDEGKEVFFKLIKQADIFITNVRMKSLVKLGLDYESLKAMNPGLVYGHFSGYGLKGPEAARPGFDFSSLWARSGAFRDWTDPSSIPFKPVGAFGDCSSSTAVVAGVMSAYVSKLKTGEGRFVTSSLYSCGIWYNMTGITSAQYGVNYPLSHKAARNPFYHIYRCGDGEYIVIIVVDYTGKYNTIMEIMGLEQYKDDPRYMYRTGDSLFKDDHVREMIDILDDQFLTKSAKEWCEIFGKADLAAELLVSMASVPEDEQAIANGYFHKYSFPTSGKEVSFPTVPVQFNGYENPDFVLPGDPGSNSEEVMAMLGYSKEEYESLKSDGTVR